MSLSSIVGSKSLERCSARFRSSRPRPVRARTSGPKKFGVSGIVAALVASLLFPQLAAAGTSYLVVIAGLGGEPKYQERFNDWALQMKSVASDELNLRPENIFYLGEKPDEAAEQMHAKSTKENVSGLFADLSKRLQVDDQLFVLLIGHGSFRSEQARFNLPGPDLTAEEFDALLEPFESQRIVFVNASSASGSFVPVLSGKNRIVVAATKTGLERNETYFGKYFVEAYVGDMADIDKNEQVSVREAFDYARSKVAGMYEEENRLRTEHAILDDDGDGAGTEVPSGVDGDGQLAMTAYLGTSEAGNLVGSDSVADENASEELKALLAERVGLEQRVADLRAQKDAMDEDLYLDELERLLLEIASVTERIDLQREIEGKKSQ